MNAHINLRNASHSDLASLGILKLNSTMAWGKYKDELRELPQARCVPEGHLNHVIIAELAHGLVGFTTIIPREHTSVAELEDLFVLPSHWRRGIGMHLLRAAEVRALALGATSVHVVANKYAQLFYESAGYVLVGTAQTDFGLAPELRKTFDYPAIDLTENCEWKY